MDEHRQDIALDDNASPVKQFGTAKLDAIPENRPTFSDRVARLSITEDASTSRSIMNDLKNSTMEGEGSRQDKRRRRSSAQSLNGLERSTTDDGSESVKQNASKERQHGYKKARKKTKKEKKELKDDIAEEAQKDAVLENGGGLLEGVGRKKRERLMLAGGTISIERLGDRVSSINDLREPIISCLHGKILDSSNLKIRGMLSVKKIIVVFVPGLQPEDLGKSAGISFKDSGPFEVKNSKILNKLPLEQPVEAFPLSAPGSKNSLYPAYNHFINRLLSKREKKLRHDELSSQKITINNLLMSLSDLIEHDYPIHPNLLDESACQVETDEENYVDTKKFDHDGSHVFALDCEMCLSEKGYVLTRVSIVDFDGTIVYDQLVKPSMPITDYLTKYSGITEEKLTSVTTTFEDVQREILNIISEDDVLVGHSLENDLNALKIRHPKIVDTSVIYEHRAGPPFRPALRSLASTHLNYNIQTGEKVGHDPVEDAKACMDLVKLKIVSGLTFGVSVSTENLFQKLSNAGIKSLKLDDDALKRKNSDNLSNFDRQIFESLLHHVDDYKFIVARLKGLALSRGYAYGISMRSDREKKSLPCESEALDVLSQGLSDLYEKSPEGTMITLISGNGDTRPYSKILAELETIDKEERTKARQERSEEVEKAVAMARDGVTVVLFKQQTLDK